MTTGHDEAHAWLAFAQGRNEDAIRLLRSVSGKQNVEGKGEVELHAREMLADMLREMDRRQDALAEYEKSFAVDPNRFNGLYGAAVAAQTLHQPQKTRAYYLWLLTNCDKGGHSNRLELTAAKAFIASHSPRMNICATHRPIAACRKQFRTKTRPHKVPCYSWSLPPSSVQSSLQDGSDFVQ